MVRTPHPGGGDGGDRTPLLSPCSPAEWISVDKDETTASKGKAPPGARATQDYAKYGGQGSAGWGALVPAGREASGIHLSTGIAQSIPLGLCVGCDWGQSRCQFCATGQGWGFQPPNVALAVFWWLNPMLEG